MSDEPIEVLISRSSLGGAAWCVNCRHPKDNHRRGGCAYPTMPDWCKCPGFVAMTADEWITWKHPAVLRNPGSPDE